MSYRDIVADGILIAMYRILATMTGIVEATQDNIQAFINAIFFGVTFMSFMDVACIPVSLK